MSIIEEIIVIYAVCQIFFGPICLCMGGALLGIDGLTPVLFNPIQLYNNTGLNRFGAWFIAIFACLTFLSWSIPYWIYKLFTVGG